jgi:hypothetical protein
VGEGKRKFVIMEEVWSIDITRIGDYNSIPEGSTMSIHHSIFPGYYGIKCVSLDLEEKWLFLTFTVPYQWI